MEIMEIKIDYDKCCWKNGKCLSCSCGGACEGCVEVCPVEALAIGRPHIQVRSPSLSLPLDFQEIIVFAFQ